MSEHPTRTIAEKIVATRIEDAPAEAVRIARDLVFDTVGTTLAGAAEPGSEIMRGFLAASASDPATVLDTTLLWSPFHAALANGSSATIPDYDDTNWVMVAHPSGVLLPVVLALGEERRISGRTATRRWAKSPAAARRASMSRAGTTPARSASSGRPPPPPGCWSSTPRPRRSRSASPPRARARSDALEHVHGFVRSGLAEGEYSLDKIGEGWSDPWELQASDAGLGIKLFASGTTSFCAGECTLEIVGRDQPDPAKIEEIEWRTTRLSHDVAHYGVPEDRNQALYSVPWAATAKVRFSLHPDIDESDDPSMNVAGELVVRLEDGSKFRHTRLRPRAYPRGEPWTEDQLVEKYREAAARSLPEDRVEASMQALSEIETLADVTEITATLKSA